MYWQYEHTWFHTHSTMPVMEFTNEPLAYFITWSVYGTFLHGDRRWWKQNGATHPPRPLLEKWHRDRLKHPIVLLSESHREIVKTTIEEHCAHRNWKLWVANPRTNHVHVVVTAVGYKGVTVRDQLKANCTRGLRIGTDNVFDDRPVWTTRGDVALVTSESELERVVEYAGEAQERMDRGK
ncbi:MAG: hypothetical protein R3C28_04020 [Pirellulaceae bacterium]